MSTNILDYGCGRGYFANYLSSKKGNVVYGIDISESDINFATSQFSRVNFIFAASLPLPFKDSFFDRIYMMDVLEHVDDLNGTLREVKRLLKQGGRLIINVPAEISEKWLLKVRPTYHEEIHHVRIFRDNEIESILESLNFNLEKKTAEGFLENFALYYLFKTAPKNLSQLSIGDWNTNVFSKLIFIALLLFDKKVLTTRLRYFPIWIITLPIGMLISTIGNRFFPKSCYYEFSKELVS